MDFDIMHATAALERTPSTLRQLLGGLDDAWTRPNEGPETFSAFDVIGHLIDGEETDWMVRAKIILAQGPERTFAPYDRFRHRSRNSERTLDSLLDEFASLRAENLAALRHWNIGPAELARRADHPSLGSVTLSQLLAAWVVHDLGHIAQVARVMAKQYRDAVGPWAAYLPVVTDRPAPVS